MEQQELLSYLNQPQRLDAQSLKQIQEELHRFPYCQTFHLLYACNLYLEGSPDFSSHLKKAAAYAADRKKLKHLIDLAKVSTAGKRPVQRPGTVHPPEPVQKPKPILPPEPLQKPKPVIPPEPVQKPKSVHPAEPFTLPKQEPIHPPLPEQERKTPVFPDHSDQPLPRVAFKPIPLTDPDHGPVTVREKLLEIVHQRLAEISREHELGARETEISSGEDSPIHSTIPPGRISFRVDQGTKFTKEELINRFIQEDPRISSPRTSLLKPLASAVEKQYEDDEIVSETLAILYWKQGNPEKSIRVYRKLCLLFPEKSSYFAARMEELEDQHHPDQKDIKS